MKEVNKTEPTVTGPEFLKKAELQRETFNHLLMPHTSAECVHSQNANVRAFQQRTFNQDLTFYDSSPVKGFPQKYIISFIHLRPNE
jgi:hypothetical protein